METVVTTPVEAPVAPAAPPAPTVEPGNIVDLLRSLDTPAPESESTDSPVVEAAPAEAPAETPAVDAAAEDAPVADDPFFEELTPDSTSEDGRRHFYTRAKSERLQQASKLLVGMQDMVPDLNMDKFKSIVERANSADALVGIFRQGAQNPESADQVVEFFKNEDPTAFGVMAIRALSQLPQANPEAFKAVQSFHNANLIQQQRAAIQQISDPAAREQQAIFVQRIEKALTGKFTPKADLLAGQQIDPIQAERAELERQRQQINQFHEGQRQQREAALVQSVDTAENNAVIGPIQEALDKVKANFTPDDLEVMRTKFTNAVRDLEQAHPEWHAQWQNLRRQALTTGAPQAIEEVAKFRRTIAQMVVRQNSQAIIGTRTGTVLTQNQAAQARAASAPPNEPALNGAPSPAPNRALDAASKASNWQQMFAAMRS